MRRDFESASEEEWRIAILRESVIAPLASKIDRTETDIEQAAAALTLGRAMVFRLLNRYRRQPKTSTLLPERRGRKPGSQRLTQEQEQVIAQQIEEFYLTPERPKLAALHRQISLTCRRLRFEPPSYKAVHSRIQRLDPKRRLQLRRGAKAASDQFRLVQSGPKISDPFDLVQIDHTLADVIIVDDIDRHPIGRPWLSLAIDVATRVVAGFCIALEPPSSLSVALVVSQAFLPKQDFLRQRQIDQEWPVHGLPRRIHLDNAKEFHAQALIRGCQEYSIQLVYRPPQRPHFGGHIERLIGTMMGEVHLLPGTTFSSVGDRGPYDSAGSAVMTLSEFESWFTWQIVGIYHQRIHSGIGLPPIQAWESGIAKNPGAIRPVLDARRFYLDFLPFELRKIRRDGIRLFGIQYCDGALAPLAGRSETKYAIKYDPRDLSRVYLKDASGQYLTIPYRDLSRPRISLWEQRWALRQLHQQARLAVNEDNLFAAIEAQRRLVNQARGQTQSARRKAQQAQQRQGAPKKAPEPRGTVGPDTEPVGPVEPYPYEIWDDN